MPRKSIDGTGIGCPDFVKELRPIIYQVSSLKGTHFTDELAKNEVERENISGLRSDRVRVSKLSIQSDQQLHFAVILYGTDEFEETDIDSDRYISYTEFDLPHYGIQQSGASQYRMDIESLNIDYEDIDKTKEIHVVLKNLSPTSKNAGVTGEVKLTFQVEARA